MISRPDWPGPAGLPEALDQAYQERLESLQILRRRVADEARLQRDIERQIADLQALQAMPEEQDQSLLTTGPAVQAVPTAAERAAVAP